MTYGEAKFKPGEIGFDRTTGEPVFVVGYEPAPDGTHDGRQGYSVLFQGLQAPAWWPFESLVTREEAVQQVTEKIERAIKDFEFHRDNHLLRLSRLQDDLERLENPGPKINKLRQLEEELGFA